MEDLVWKIDLFGVEIGWCRHRQYNGFYQIEDYCLYYFWNLRIWLYKKYYKKENEGWNQ